MKFERIFVGFFLLGIGLLTSIDIIEDIQEGAEMRHLGLDMLIALFSFIVCAFLIYKNYKDQERYEYLKNEKEQLSELVHNLKIKSELLLEGLNTKVDQSFTEWSLTKAERDIAMFLLKGSSPKEISNYRGSSERTVQTQISSIYKKSGSKSRDEFTSYFLEEFMSFSESEKTI